MDTNAIKDVMNGYDIISFDIFDTLLIRPYVRPDDLFKHMESALEIRGFAAERTSAERRARHKVCEEITLDEIYDEITEEYRHLKETEMEYERTVLTCNPDAKRLYDHAAELRKKIILISDMYLPSAFLKDVLRTKGYTGDPELFVSCEHRKNKHSGDLYHHVLTALDVKPERMLHIGDNKHSDHNVPEGLGIHSVLYEKIIYRYFRNNRKAKTFYSSKKDFERSVLVSMDAIKWINDHVDGVENEYWYRFAYRFGGPIASMFADFVASNVDNELLLFIARDGYNLKKVYDIMFPDSDNVYVYAPRLYNIAFGDGDEDRKYEIHLVNYFSHVPEVKALISGEVTKKNAVAIIEKNRELFERLKKEAAETFSRYINGIVGSRDVCIADVTTIRFSSQRLIQRTIKKYVMGLYYTKLPKYEGFKCKHFNEPMFHNWTNVNLSEFLMSSSEFPVIGLSDKGEPIHQTDNPECEVYRAGIAKDITKGCEDYAKDLISIFGDLRPKVSHRTICRWMNSYIRFCTGNDRKHIMKIQWASGADHKRYTSAVLTPENFLTYIANKASEFLHMIRK